MSLELAQKYINDHNNPITKKLESFGSKLFLSSTEENEKQKEKCLIEIENSLKHDRVDRRVARGIAEWLPEQNFAKVTKVTGATSGFGFQNKNGKFLNPEETLFLLEINKLELFHKNASMSIEEAFKNVKDLNKYLVFKQLNLQGYKLKSGSKSKVIAEIESEASTSQEIIEPSAKIPKLDDKAAINAEILEKLRQKGPKTFKGNIPQKQSADYYINSRTNTEKGPTPLFVCNEDNYEFKSNESNLNVYAVCDSDSVAFYKFYNVNIPIL